MMERTSKWRLSSALKFVPLWTLFALCLIGTVGCIDQEDLLADEDRPTITNLNPTRGLVGDTVLVEGKNLEQVDTAYINGIEMQLLSQTNENLRFRVSERATSGPVAVHSAFGYSLGPEFTVIDSTAPPVPEVTVTTVAGLTDNDNIGSPWQIVYDGSGNFYFTDPESQQIKKITANGVVSIFAGSGDIGFSDGQANKASFNIPAGLAIDARGNLYVADLSNHAIRKITAAGVVSTVAGLGQAGFVDGDAQQQAQFNLPIDVAVDGDLLFISDFGNHAIRQLDLKLGFVTTIAGDGAPGFQNGAAKEATFNFPNGMTLDQNKNLLIADAFNHSIRLLDRSTNTVSTYMGTGSSGFTNGSLGQARFNLPYDVGTDAIGNVYVADRNNHSIRKISDKKTSVLAGTGTAGNMDGDGAMAQFNNPYGIAVVSASEIWVCDYSNGRIRKITIK